LRHELAFELHKTQPVAHAIGIVQKKAIMHEEVIHKPSATQPDPGYNSPLSARFLRIFGAQKSALARHIALAERSMSERVKQAASDLRAIGKTTFAS